MRRTLLTLTAVASAIICAAVCVAWGRSVRTRTAVEFRRADGIWEVASTGGRLRLDNSPQCRLEREWTLGERRRLSRECVELAREHDRVRVRLEHAGDDDDLRKPIAAEFAGVNERIVENTRQRRMIFARPESTTPPVAHSVPAFAAAGAAALLPTLWLYLAVRSCTVKRARAKHGLCAACGYDLRGTPQRCPECGAVPLSAPEHEDGPAGR